ncbi:MAG TPA: hypothetical protein VNL77_06800 [Roseiflexaceae bacterium]|nr:hypothetical protein [Roseiflexaceae bacterium]
MSGGGARGTVWRWCAALLLFVLALSAPPAAPASAQSDLRYFPETGHYLRGAFRQFWERNGGLALFGFPITEEYFRSDGRIVQYFQRARFELASANPVVVELGQLGREVTGDRIFPQPVPFQTSRQRRYFPETGYSLKGLFRQTWEGRGGVRIFGYPISEEINENINGQWLLVQYFERARFELRLYPSRVELGLLGQQLAPIQLRDPWPPGIAPERPLNEDGTPRPPPFRPGAAANLRVVFEGGRDGTFRVEGEGFRPGERVRFFLEAPDCRCRVQAIEQQPLADVNGSISYAQVRFNTRGFQDGRWFLSAQGQTSGRTGVAAFTVGGPPPGQAPGPGGPAVRLSPNSGAIGQAFLVQGEGFEPREKVSLWLTAPDQSVRGIDATPEADRGGSISGAGVRITADNTFRIGTWFITAQGRKSGRKAIGSFQIVAGGAPPPGQPFGQPAPVPPGGPGDPNRMTIMIHDVLRPIGDASILPLAAPPGFTFTFTGGGFDPNERVSVWFTRPGGAVEAVPASQVQRNGAAVRVAFRGGQQEGDWAITAQGVTTGRAVVARFKVTRDYVAPPGTRRPANRNGSVSPSEGGQRTGFRIQAQGFRPGEALEFWITTPDGLYVLQSQAQADGGGRIGRNPALVVQFSSQHPAGVYGYHYRGTRSGVRADIYFTFTGQP